jgi:hypothetical protein
MGTLEQLIMSSGETPWLRYCVVARPLPGQTQSGDQHLVAAFAGGVLIAVVDGLGHGGEAHAAAVLAVDTLRDHAGEPPVELMKRCHHALKKTRGAVITLASFSAADSAMTWLAVGNVEGLLVRAGDAKPLAVLPRGGIVGDRLPPLRPATEPVAAGDLLLFATDGLCSAFYRDVRPAEQPAPLVRELFLRHARDTDDALLLGAQWTNGNQISAPSQG